MAMAWWRFQECGWPSWLCLLLGLFGFALAVTALGLALQRARASVLWAWLALGVALAPFGAGALGMEIGRAKIDRVLEEPSVDASLRERIRAEGYREAGSCVAVGGTLSVVPLLFAVVALTTAYLNRVTVR